MVKRCCNPFGKVKHTWWKHYRSLRKVTDFLAGCACDINVVVAVGALICDNCRNAITKQYRIAIVASHTHNDDEDDDTSLDDIVMEVDELPQEVELDVMDYTQPQPHASTSMMIRARTPSNRYVDKSDLIAQLNKLLPLLSVEPIDIKKIDKSRSYCRNMLQKISAKLGEKIFDISPLDTSADIDQTESEQEIISQLKSKFVTTSNKHDKIQILSILPMSWSARKISKEFNTTYHLGLLTKELVRENGILCEPKKRAATTYISQETKQIVNNFFLDDNISRVCAGKRDYVTIDENNQKIQKQRRLLLMNLEEAYALFKLQNIGLKIGFSTFALLRPKECLLALNNFGTHAVCVCQYHQNVKLIFERMKRMLNMTTYRDLFVQMLCVEPTDECHLMQCDQCPGIKEIENYMANLITINEIDDVSYKQWIFQQGKYICCLFFLVII